MRRTYVLQQVIISFSRHPSSRSLDPEVSCKYKTETLDFSPVILRTFSSVANTPSQSRPAGALHAARHRTTGSDSLSDRIIPPTHPPHRPTKNHPQSNNTRAQRHTANMPARQTRRSAAKAREAQASSDEESSQVILNGNGSAHKTSEPSDSAPDENIFLFWPNVIGMDHHAPRSCVLGTK